VVGTRLYELGQAIYGRVPSGRDRQRLRESLSRLVEVTLTIPGYDVTRSQIVGDLAGESQANLLEAVYIEHRRLRLTTSAEMGTLKGTENVRIRLAYWYAEQVRAGYTTYLDLAMFRALGVGLAARVWAYLEAEQYEPKTPDLEATYIGLGAPALAALDLAGYTRTRDARVKLAVAGERIVATDARYTRIERGAAPTGTSWWSSAGAAARRSKRHGRSGPRRAPRASRRRSVAAGGEPPRSRWRREVCSTYGQSICPASSPGLRSIKPLRSTGR